MFRLVARIFLRKCATYNHTRLRLTNSVCGSRNEFKYLSNSFITFGQFSNQIVDTKHNGVTNKAWESFIGAYDKNGFIYSSHVQDVLEKLDIGELEESHSLLLLQCCGATLVDLTMEERAALCHKLWKKLEQDFPSLSVEHYNTYLTTCCENRAAVNFESFLKAMKCRPSQETYRLLLDCACEIGDVKQAVDVVAAMKKEGFPADERLFDALVLGHTINGGLSAAEEILATMQTAHVPSRPVTYFGMIRGLAWRDNKEEFTRAVNKHSSVIDEKLILKLMAILGLKEKETWLDEVLQLTGSLKSSKQNEQFLQEICINLVHSGKPRIAVNFYNKFVEPAVPDTDDYALFLLKEMLHASVLVETITEIAEKLRSSESNPYALEQLTEVALREGYFDEALQLFDAMPLLRCHYFWPILRHAFRKDGETGVLKMVTHMLNKNVRPDLSTVEFYVIPLCDSTDPQQLLIRLQNLGFTVRELLTPLLAYLIKANRIDSAYDLCKSYENVALHSDLLFKPLAQAWKRFSDNENIINILRRLSQTPLSTGDYVGQFLLRALSMCRTPTDYNRYMELLQRMKRKGMQISLASSDSLLFRLGSPHHENSINSKLRELIDELVHISIKQPQTHLLHPRDMDINGLENHLIELQNKNMETRGILRRLIQSHARESNTKRVEELRRQFFDLGYSETAGMKASLLYSYLTNGNVKAALDVYSEIKKSEPTFLLDEFKVVDLATALVANNRFDAAVDVLEGEATNRKIRGGPAIIRNCTRLLHAATSETQVNKLFDVLVKKGYCEPINIVLGPLVKIHLNSDNVESAVEAFKNITKKYKCTPLQLELASAVVKSGNEQLIQEVLNAVSKVYGADQANQTFAAALAQNGHQNSLRKLLGEIKSFNKKELEKRCTFWVSKNHLLALETLAEASYNLPMHVLDRSVVYHSIMKIHSINNDCEAAVSFYQRLQEKNENVPQQVVDELLRLTNRCKYKMPEYVGTNQSL